MMLGRIMVHKFGTSATILDIPSLGCPHSAMRLLHVPAAAVVGLACLVPVPAQAFSISTAAWATAGAICRALGAGLSSQEAIRIGLADSRRVWAVEMRDPAFPRLVADQAMRQCPEYVIEAYPTQSGGSQL